MIKMERPYRRIRTLMDSHFDPYTTQRAKVIDELFLAYGLKDFSNNAQQLMKRKNLVRRIESMVKRRHAIVHEGDLNDHGGLRVINGKKVWAWMSDLSLFVTGAHKLTERRMK